MRVQDGRSRTNVDEECAGQISKPSTRTPDTQGVLVGGKFCQHVSLGEPPMPTAHAKDDSLPERPEKALRKLERDGHLGFVWGVGSGARATER